MADGKQAEKRGKSQYGYEMFHCIGHRALVNGYSLFSVLDTRNTEMSVLKSSFLTQLYKMYRYVCHHLGVFATFI